MGAYEGPNRHEEMQRANDLVQELNACDVANPMTESALKAWAHRSGAQHGNPKFTAWAALCAIFVDSSKGNV